MKRNKKLLALTSAFLVAITFATGCSSTPGPGMNEKEQEEYLEEVKSYSEQQEDKIIQKYKDGEITDEDLAVLREGQPMISAAICCSRVGLGDKGVLDIVKISDEENDTLTIEVTVDETCDKDKIAKEFSEAMKKTLFRFGFKDTKVIVEFIN